MVLLLSVVAFRLSAFPESVHAERSEALGKKVLVVASSHAGYRWSDDIVAALGRELSGAELTVFYMDTQKNHDQASAKGEEAYALYQKIRPDAVIAIDDNAQAFFVVPYLKDKVDTPVIFCGINDDAAKYGFPASNVTGVLEKMHYLESIAFAQIVDPGIKSIAILYKPNASNEINLAQIDKEKGRFPASVPVSAAVTTLEELRNAVTEYSAKVDAFLLLNLAGIAGDDGVKMEGQDVISLVVDAADLVTIAVSDWEVEAGALCGVIKSGDEQGVLAAGQLKSHWRGALIKDLPVLSNRNGRRYLNLKTFKKLRLRLRPEIIIGVNIITGT